MSPLDVDATRHFYDRISSAYDALADSGEHAARESGIAALGAQPGEEALEIGYGTGHSLEALVRATSPGGKVSGIDISQGMHDAALHRLEHEGLGARVDLCVAPVPPIPWPDDSFDLVNMSFTLELFPLDVIPALLQETKRVLRPSGRVGIVSMSIPSEGQKDSMMETSYKWMHRHFPHIVDCQPIAAARFLKDAGFVLTHEQYVAIWSMPVAVLVGTIGR